MRGTRLDALPEALRPRNARRRLRHPVAFHGTHASIALRLEDRGHKPCRAAARSSRRSNGWAPAWPKKVLEDGATVSLATSNMRVAEIEFAYRFGRDLQPRSRSYDVAEVMTAVATLHPAIEIPGLPLQRLFPSWARRS